MLRIPARAKYSQRKNDTIDIFIKDIKHCVCDEESYRAGGGLTRSVRWMQNSKGGRDCAASFGFIPVCKQKNCGPSSGRRKVNENPAGKSTCFAVSGFAFLTSDRSFPVLSPVAAI